MAAAVSTVMDLRRLARKRVPRAFFEYADGGSYGEITLRENREAFGRMWLRQQIMVDVADRSLGTTILGHPVALPLALAPTGLAGLQCGAGEICAARAAAAIGVPFCLSTMSICSIEQVRESLGAPFWFQVYVMRDRAFTRELIARAAQARCSALMLTADLTVQGQRHRDIRNGLTVPPRLTLANCIDVLTKPRWLRSVMRAPQRSFGNLAGRISGTESLTTLTDWISRQFDPTLTWRDLEWIRAAWPGRLLLKGIMNVEDAKQATASGVDAVVVSNHGGRQLDGAIASIEALEPIVQAVAPNCEVLVDGGITSGQDLLKALALGARAGLIGKAYLYGLGAKGEAGARRAIEIIRDELDVSMALTGQRHAAAISRHILRTRDGQPWPLRTAAASEPSILS